MQSVLDNFEQNGFPNEFNYLQYFSVSFVQDYVNHVFVLRLVTLGKNVAMRTYQNPTDALVGKANRKARHALSVVSRT